MSTSLTTNVSQGFSREDIELIKNTICKGASDSELKLFLQQCQRTGLDPFCRQIFAVKRWDAKEGREMMAIQVSIDGFRLVADRTGKYEGQTPPYWCGRDGQWREVWLDSDVPSAAKVGVYCKGMREPMWGIARFSSYAQTNKQGDLNPMWRKMPDVMIAKCAESLALRKAFPNDLSGLYTEDEMGQANDSYTPPAPAPRQDTPAKASKSLPAASKGGRVIETLTAPELEAEYSGADRQRQVLFQECKLLDMSVEEMKDLHVQMVDARVPMKLLEKAVAQFREERARAEGDAKDWGDVPPPDVDSSAAADDTTAS